MEGISSDYLVVRGCTNKREKSISNDRTQSKGKYDGISKSRARSSPRCWSYSNIWHFKRDCG